MALQRGKGSTPPPAQKNAPPEQAPAAEKAPEVTSADDQDEVESEKVAVDRKLYLATRRPIRDPYSDIIYNRNVPKPAGDAGWCKAQLDANILTVYVPPVDPEQTED